MSFPGWTGQSLQWYINASEYTGFHKRMAEIIAPRISGSDTLLDLGCGPGCIDLHLHGYVGSITAADIEPIALESLRGRCEEAGIRNITTVQADAEQYRQEADVVLMSMYSPKNLFPVCEMAGRYVVRITNESSGEPRPDGKQRSPRNGDTLAAELDALGLKYDLEPHRMEFGQPFASYDDAMEYVRHYRGGLSMDEVNAYLSGRIIMTGEDEYPLYMPNNRNFWVAYITSGNNDN